MVSSASVAARTGKAATISTLVTSEVHVKIGIFIRLMPGARMRRMVTMKLMPLSVVPSPDIWSAQM
ncbi:hypothetical protein D3C77_610230 [compost metagenome]